MKTYAHGLSVVICIVLAAPIANADSVVFSGAIYDVVISDPVPVGAFPGGERLLGFDLSIVNTSGNPDLDPAGFNGNAPNETDPGDPSAWPAHTGFTTGLATVGASPDFIVTVDGTPGFHNQWFAFYLGSPTEDYPDEDLDVATEIDTHFQLLPTDILPQGMGPSEDFNLADLYVDWQSTDEPLNATGPWASWAANDFGNRLYGHFDVVGGAAADIDGDGDPTVWALAHFAVPVNTTIYMDFLVSGVGPGEVITGSFTAVPEPATMSLLALGGLAALRRRGR